MKIKSWLRFLIISCLTFNITQAYCQPRECDDKIILGRVETVILPQQNITLNAKLDSGASMTSISARNIHIFVSDSNYWVEFTLTTNNQGGKIILKRPLKRYVHILKRSEENEYSDVNQYSTRPVIDLQICIGSAKLTTEVNLIDRMAFKYPMLLGANTLKKINALIDVNREHLITTHCPKS